MHESVVPIRARNTVTASISMNARPWPAPKSASPTITIKSPIGAAEAPALVMP